MQVEKSNLMDYDGLWELPETPSTAPNPSWDSGLLDSLGEGLLLLEDESIWREGGGGDSYLSKTLEDFSDGSFGNGGSPLADWLDERVDLDKIDEFLAEDGIDDIDSAMDVLGEILTTATPDASFMDPTNTITIDLTELPLSTAEAGPSCVVVTTECPDDIHSHSSSSGFVALSSNSTPVTSPQSVVPTFPPSPQQPSEDSADFVDIFEDQCALPAPSHFPPSPSPSTGLTTEATTTTRTIRGCRKTKRASPKKPYDPPDRQPEVDGYDDETSDNSFDDQGSIRFLRKRYQNRDAANRYRLKKRAVAEALSVEEEALVSRNKELHEKVTQLSTEVGYLKGLMKEILKAKGLIKGP